MTPVFGVLVGSSNAALTSTAPVVGALVGGAAEAVPVRSRQRLRVKYQGYL